MKSFLRDAILSLVLLLSFNGSAQTFINRWAYSSGNVCVDQNNTDIQTDKNGNHFTCGTIYSDASIAVADLDPSPAGVFPATGSIFKNDFYVASYDVDGNFLSGLVVGGAGTDVCRSIAFDNANNLILAGTFQGTVDFDPGSGTTNLVSNGSDDVFLAKYSNAGALLWAVSFGSTLSDNAIRVVTDNQDNIYIKGHFPGTMDIDPSSASTVLTSNGSTDVFVAKFNPAGSLLVGRSFGSGGAETSRDLVLDAGKRVYMTGSFVGIVDFDPSTSGTFTLAEIGGSADIYVTRFDSLLNFHWAASLSSTNTCFARDINIDNSGNILLAGHYAYSPLDLDLSPTNTITFATGISNNVGFLAKYDNLGNYIWAGVFAQNSVYNAEVTSAVSIWSDNSGNIYSAGQFATVVDFDLSSTGTFTLDNISNGPSYYFSKYSSSGAFISAKRLSTGFAFMNAAHQDPQGSLLVAGNIGLNVNFDPTGSNPAPVPYGAVCQNIYGCMAKYGDCLIPTVTSVSSNTNNMCANTTITLSVNGTLNAASSWRWAENSCNSNTLATGSTAVVTPTANTVYYVKGIGGCTGRNLACNSISVTVVPAPTLALSSGDTHTACANSVFTIEASGADSYSWSEGTAGSTLQASAATSTNYIVTGTDATSGCKGTASVAVTIYSLIPLQIHTTNVNPKDTICKNETMELKGTGIGASSFTWAVTPGVFGPMPTQVMNGSYVQANIFTITGPVVFTVTAVGPEGCKSSATYTITVLDCVAGLHEQSVESALISVFPVPSAKGLTIELKGVKAEKLVVSNAIQQVVSELTMPGDDTILLDAGSWKAGVYFLNFYREGRLIASKKVIKE